MEKKSLTGSGLEPLTRDLWFTIKWQSLKPDVSGSCPWWISARRAMHRNTANDRLIPKRLYWFDALLINFRLIVNDDEFDEID